jgi:short-subunit dehydrogenase involved in D-alanine esterification of teichoic acids
MQAPKSPFVSLAGPFAPSGNTILVTGGASGAIYVVALIARCIICVQISSGIGLALAAELLKLGNTVCLL